MNLTPPLHEERKRNVQITSCAERTVGRREYEVFANNARNNRWSLIIGLIFIVVFSFISWFMAPKGETQTYVLIYPSDLFRETHNVQRRPLIPTFASQCIFKQPHAVYFMTSNIYSVESSRNIELKSNADILNSSFETVSGAQLSSSQQRRVI